MFHCDDDTGSGSRTLPAVSSAAKLPNSSSPSPLRPLLPATNEPETPNWKAAVLVGLQGDAAVVSGVLLWLAGVVVVVGQLCWCWIRPCSSALRSPWVRSGTPRVSHSFDSSRKMLRREYPNCAARSDTERPADTPSSRRR